MCFFVHLNKLFNFKQTVITEPTYGFELYCYEINNHILICSFHGGTKSIPPYTVVDLKVPSGYKDMTSTVSGNFKENKPLRYSSDGTLSIIPSEGELSYNFYGELITFK